MMMGDDDDDDDYHHHHEARQGSPHATTIPWSGQGNCIQMMGSTYFAVLLLYIVLLLVCPASTRSGARGVGGFPESNNDYLVWREPTLAIDVVLLG